jgi:hypothetical protein
MSSPRGFGLRSARTGRITTERMKGLAGTPVTFDDATMAATRSETPLARMTELASTDSATTRKVVLLGRRRQR